MLCSAQPTNRIGVISVTWWYPAIFFTLDLTVDILSLGTVLALFLKRTMVPEFVKVSE